MPLIRLERVAKSFAETGEVIQPLDLEIRSGEFTALLGPSGCGKSTLLRMLAGLEPTDRGQIRFESEPRTAFVFQEAHLLPWLSVLENVRLPLELERKITSKTDRDRLARETLEQVGLGDAFHKNPAQLSGGMKMRVSLARALVARPNLLLLDEPFAALDETTRRRLQEDLLQYWRQYKMTVVFVTHSTAEAAFLAQRQIEFSARPAHVIADRRKGERA